MLKMHPQDYTNTIIQQNINQNYCDFFGSDKLKPKLLVYIFIAEPCNDLYQKLFFRLSLSFSSGYIKRYHGSWI